MCWDQIVYCNLVGCEHINSTVQQLEMSSYFSTTWYQLYDCNWMKFLQGHWRGRGANWGSLIREISFGHVPCHGGHTTDLHKNESVH